MVSIDKIKQIQRFFIDNWGVIIYNSTIDNIKDIVSKYKLFLERINNIEISFAQAADDLCIGLDCDFEITSIERFKLKKLYSIASFLLDNKISYLCKD